MRKPLASKIAIPMETRATSSAAATRMAVVVFLCQEARNLSVLGNRRRPISSRQVTRIFLVLSWSCGTPTWPTMQQVLKRLQVGLLLCVSALEILQHLHADDEKHLLARAWTLTYCVLAVSLLLRLTRAFYYAAVAALSTHFIIGGYRNGAELWGIGLLLYMLFVSDADLAPILSAKSALELMVALSWDMKLFALLPPIPQPLASLLALLGLAGPAMLAYMLYTDYNVVYTKSDAVKDAGAVTMLLSFYFSWEILGNLLVNGLDWKLRCVGAVVMFLVIKKARNVVAEPDDWVTAALFTLQYLRHRLNNV